MVSDEQIDEAVRLAIQASQQYQQQMRGGRRGQLARPAPQLRMNQQGMLEVVAMPDTHDEWRAMNAGLDPG